MAARISSEGSVTVSERRSMRFMAMLRCGAVIPARLSQLAPASANDAAHRPGSIPACAVTLQPSPAGDDCSADRCGVGKVLSPCLRRVAIVHEERQVLKMTQAELN